MSKSIQVMSLFLFCNLWYDNYMKICHYSTKIIRFMIYPWKWINAFSNLQHFLLFFCPIICNYQNLKTRGSILIRWACPLVTTLASLKVEAGLKNRKIKRAAKPQTDHLKLECSQCKQPKPDKKKWEIAILLNQSPNFQGIFLLMFELNLIPLSQWSTHHSYCNALNRGMYSSETHRFGVRKKTKHSATLCLWPCNSPTPGQNCAGAGRLWSSSDVKIIQDPNLPTHNELHRKNATKNDKNFKQNQKKPSNNVTPLLNHLERMEIHWTHLDVDSGSSVATCKQSFVEKHCVSVSMRFSMDLCGSNHSSFWSDINAEVRLDMCPHACWHLQV